MGLFLGALGEPASLDPTTLLKDFADAPEAAEGNDGEHRLPEDVDTQQRGYCRCDAEQEEYPPAFNTEIVFAFDNQWMKEADNEEGDGTDGEAKQIVGLEKFSHSQRVKKSGAGENPRRLVTHTGFKPVTF